MRVPSIPGNCWSSDERCHCQAGGHRRRCLCVGRECSQRSPSFDPHRGCVGRGARRSGSLFQVPGNGRSCRHSQRRHCRSDSWGVDARHLHVLRGWPVCRRELHHPLARQQQPVLSSHCRGLLQRWPGPDGVILHADGLDGIRHGRTLRVCDRQGAGRRSANVRGGGPPATHRHPAHRRDQAGHRHVPRPHRISGRLVRLPVAA
mmetsp:Transcript_52641/g.138235  ORF Transcript_52641/g.138235 Transcript_52641/m.138235 type:complete len:204 (-) Transcript_52641:3154-3765(-)